MQLFVLTYSRINPSIFITGFSPTVWCSIRRQSRCLLKAQIFPPLLLLLPLNINGPHFLHLDRFLTHPVRFGPSPAIKPHHQAHSFARLLSVKFCYFSARSIIFPTRYLLKHLQLSSQHSLLSLLGYALVLSRDYLAEFHPPLLESWSTEQTNRFVSNHNSITWVHLF